MDVFHPSTLALQIDPSGHAYVDFLKTNSLSVGYALWQAGVEDHQKPHTEDEVYYVVSGKAAVRIGGEETLVGPGSVIFVPAGVVHRFLHIEEEVRAIVFWSPPRGTGSPRAARSNP